MLEIVGHRRQADGRAPLVHVVRVLRRLHVKRSAAIAAQLAAVNLGTAFAQGDAILEQRERTAPGFAGFHGGAHQREIFFLRGQIAVLDNEEQRAARIFAHVVRSQPAVLREDGLDLRQVGGVGRLHLAPELVCLRRHRRMSVGEFVEAFAVFLIFVADLEKFIAHGGEARIEGVGRFGLRRRLGGSRERGEEEGDREEQSKAMRPEVRTHAKRRRCLAHGARGAGRHEKGPRIDRDGRSLARPDVTRLPDRRQGRPPAVVRNGRSWWGGLTHLPLALKRRITSALMSMRSEA